MYATRKVKSEGEGKAHIRTGTQIKKKEKKSGAWGQETTRDGGRYSIEEGLREERRPPVWLCADVAVRAFSPTQGGVYTS